MARISVPLTRPRSFLVDRFHLGGASDLPGFAGRGVGPRSAAPPTAPATPEAPPAATATATATAPPPPQQQQQQQPQQQCGVVGGDALGGDARLVVGAALSAPPPLEYFASRGWRLVASLQAGVLSASAPYPWESGNNGNAAGSRSGGGGGTGVGLVARAAEEVRASASVGVGIPVGRGSELSLLCSRPLQLQPQDRPEKWQIAISLGIG